jgi:hypothetical protein
VGGGSGRGASRAPVDPQREGEAAPVFAPDGDLLFVSARPDPDAAAPPAEARAALWRLPAAGEACVTGTRPGGIGGLAVAHEAGTVVVTAATLPGAATGEDDQARRTARKDAGVSGILHAGHPVRFWDHDLGPDAPRLLVHEGGPGGSDGGAWRDLTPDPGGALVETSFDVSPDGATAVAAWAGPSRGGGTRSALVAIDTATGERRVLADAPDAEFTAPVVSPDGTRVACLRETVSTPDVPPTSGSSCSRWPAGSRWTPLPAGTAG